MGGKGFGLVVVELGWEWGVVRLVLDSRRTGR